MTHFFDLQGVDDVAKELSRREVPLAVGPDVLIHIRWLLRQKPLSWFQYFFTEGDDGEYYAIGCKRDWAWYRRKIVVPTWEQLIRVGSIMAFFGPREYMLVDPDRSKLTPVSKLDPKFVFEKKRKLEQVLSAYAVMIPHCPKDHGEMQLKISRRGSFYFGCSLYAKCRVAMRWERVLPSSDVA